MPQFPGPKPLGHLAGKEIFKFAFEQYSQLSLTEPSDRSIAISGVVKRFVKCLDSRETCGIFEKYLHQSLLWQRADDKMMRRIPKTQKPIPSWSWMAYEGGIKYIEIGDDIQKSQISFPSAESSQSGISLDMELREPVRELQWEDVDEDEQLLRFDGETPDKDDKTCTQKLKFAIIGREVLHAEEVQVYVLIVKPCSAGNAYERVGAGYVLERHIGTAVDTTPLV